ncbi:amidase [Saccharopolyspora hirsuta]|uniref:Amidase n=1 Tax=Saccharopolyspora hirsuta TaxID=1837 RepID=A0A5M7C4Y6_SACHI|nr:amidase [Saccharopolyspora hirsuta]KAA5837139.1 amidase [Saccharopolyspora hirsuta]
MIFGSVVEAGRALRAGATTSTALVEGCQAVADELDEALGVYLTRFREPALAAAQRADEELAAGVDRGPLHGIPLGIKDLIAVAEGPTTAQSLVLGDWGRGVDAAVVSRLKAAGAVITGKTTTMEFGCGIPDGTKPFPTPRNPWAPERWAGGSSSGTASGVAAGMFLAGLGSDTAGSIRMPAAFCGVSGLLPTFGRVPRSGCVPLAHSVDRVGPLARTARDCALLLEVISGADQGDPDSMRWSFESPDFDADLTGLRIGVVRDVPDGADPALPEAFDRAIAVLADLGAEICEVVLPYWSEMVAAVVVSVTSEGLAHHRGDLRTRWGDYFTAARGLLAAGALASGADYVQAQRARRFAQGAVDELFREVDVIACPTAVIGAPLLAELANDAGQQDDDELFAKIRTPYWNAVANPVLAIPVGATADGRPLSVQLAGAVRDEATVLRVGAAFQTCTNWHERRPGRVAG